MLTVSHRDGDVTRHFRSPKLFYAPADPGQDPRRVGTREPLWNLLDLTREGRPVEVGRSSPAMPEPVLGDPAPAPTVRVAESLARTMI
jgi:hypothetical protein